MVVEPLLAVQDLLRAGLPAQDALAEPEVPEPVPRAGREHDQHVGLGAWRRGEGAWHVSRHDQEIAGVQGEHRTLQRTLKTLLLGSTRAASA